MKASGKNITPALALALVLFGANVASAGYFNVVQGSFDRAFTEVKEYNFDQVAASWDRLLTEKKPTDIHQLALASFDRLLGEGVFVKQSDKLSPYDLALAGWEEVITKAELCGSVSPVILACATNTGR